MPLREKVLAERLKRKWTQTELAIKVGVQSATISRIESGEERDVRASTLRGLAGAFDVSVDYLIDLSDKWEPRDRGSLPPDARSLLERYLELPLADQDKIQLMVQLLYVAKVREDMSRLGNKLTSLEKAIKTLSAKTGSPEGVPVALELIKLWYELTEGAEELRSKAGRSLTLLSPMMQVQLGMPADVVESGAIGVRQWYGNRYREEMDRSFKGTNIHLDDSGHIVNRQTGKPLADKEIVAEYLKGIVDQEQTSA
jgi:transcriptional regulator with XRE-family HTH domain